MHLILLKEDRDLVLLLDNFDTSTKRDKKETGRLMGKYADVMVATGFNEVYQRVDLEPAQELLDAAVDSKCRNHGRRC